MLIVVCGPEGQISELRLTKNCDAVVTLFNMPMYIHGIFSALLSNFFFFPRERPFGAFEAAHIVLLRIKHRFPFVLGFT